jgi:RNA polymerase sigma-70 factor (ECF subfamily)
MDELLTNIEKHRHEFYRFVLRNVWDSSKAEDVFASGVLVAYENRDKFTLGTNFRAWMYKILANKCFVANRETKRVFEPLDEEVPDPEGAEFPIDHADILRNPRDFLEQCGDEVYHAFRRLSTAQRSCILLKDVERFSYQEIADILGMPVATVMTHLARGRTVLRQRLREYARSKGIIRSMPRLMPRSEGAGPQSQKSEVVME